MMVGMTWPQYRRRQVTIDGRVVHLRPQAVELVSLLLLSDPRRFVSWSDMIEGIWPDPEIEPEQAQNIVNVLLVIVRRAGVTIENDFGLGYRIPSHARGRERARLAA